MTDGFTVFRLPRVLWHCTFETFDWRGVAPASLYQHLQTLLQAVAGTGAPHILLSGLPGIGKTHLGVATYRAASAQVGTALVTWLHVPTFCETVKQSYSEPDLDPWADVQEARRLVVLDDLFGRELTSHEKDQIITRLVDLVYTNGAALLATMNQSLDELRARLPPHEISRLLSQCTIIPMRAETGDHRLRAP